MSTGKLYLSSSRGFHPHPGCSSPRTSKPFSKSSFRSVRPGNLISSRSRRRIGICVTCWCSLSKYTWAMWSGRFDHQIAVSSASISTNESISATTSCLMRSRSALQVCWRWIACRIPGGRHGFCCSGCTGFAEDSSVATYRLTGQYCTGMVSNHLDRPEVSTQPAVGLPTEVSTTLARKGGLLPHVLVGWMSPPKRVATSLPQYANRWQSTCGGIVLPLHGP